MAKFRTKPIISEATRWFKNGDHPEDGDELLEGRVVGYYTHPKVPGDKVCDLCGKIMRVHGWMEGPKGGHTVCPGDWIITEESGERHPVKPDIFAETLQNYNVL